ncbi:L-threonylcarbamoyladenylate synthase [Rubinisphaera margarita]|uniref:L-threonylcarbamoyladenylate synthase n=1 Tax=Rubinisphaera margarita TaxID=2909586 RepID=UPI001EE89BBE|nr:L-threonylcarbamoyladenylate synthase [Rubinisphaera margarita]MCG6156126.1 threonylcarbamoyl-AMP synthase [Rubinisphaera margarita]
MSASSPIGQDVDRAASILRCGGLVAMPTETVYGLAANAFDPTAVAKIFEAKQRPTFDPLIVHIADQDQLAMLVQGIPARYQILMETFWPGPLTLLFEKTAEVADLVTSGLPTVAVRMPDHSMALELIHKAGTPLAAPSANPFGRTSPTTADHVARQLGGKVDYILDAGPSRVGVESTILRESGGRFEILRPGGITRERLEEVLGQEVVLISSDESGTAIEAPGQLKEHYAPRTPLVVAGEEDESGASQRRALMTVGLEQQQDRKGFTHIVNLSPAGDLVEAAAGFFAALHELDRMGLDLIVVDRFPEEGLGIALNDRLGRAVHRD